MATAPKLAFRSPWYLTQLGSALLGTAISLYLLVQHTRVTNGIQAGSSFCSLGAHADCDVVNSSAYSTVLGIPLAGIGACYFFLLFILALVSPPGDRAFSRAQRWMAWLNLAALAVDSALAVIQAGVLMNFCILCFSTYVMSALSLLGNLRLHAGGAADDRSVWRRVLFRGKTHSEGHVRNPGLSLSIVGYAAFVTMVALVPRFVKSGADQYQHADNAVEQFIAGWGKLPSRRLPIGGGGPQFGNPLARVQVVAFSDFECPFCKRAAFTLQTALSPMKDKLVFAFKHFPLDSTCNPHVPYQLHPQACNLARLSACAHRKGKFWEFHDRAFSLTESDLRNGAAAFPEHFRELLSAAEIRDCLASEVSKRAILEDTNMGNSLGIRGTPSVYINGKPVTVPLTVETLRKLVEMEAKAGETR